MTSVAPIAAGRRPRPADRRARTAAIAFALAVHLAAITAIVLAISPPPLLPPARSVALTLAPRPVAPPAPPASPRLGGASPETARKRPHVRSLRPRPAAALPPVIQTATPILPAPAPTLDAPKGPDLASPLIGAEVGMGIAGSGAGPGRGAGSGVGSTGSDALTAGPVWERFPTRAQVRAAYPHAAYIARLAGSGRLRCRIREDGRVDRCEVVEDTPSGQGFGQAALELSRAFRFRPATVGGRPQAVSRVIPFSFDVTKIDAPGSPRR